MFNTLQFPRLVSLAQAVHDNFTGKKVQDISAQRQELDGMLRSLGQLTLVVKGDAHAASVIKVFAKLPDLPQGEFVFEGDHSTELSRLLSGERGQPTDSITPEIVPRECLPQRETLPFPDTGWNKGYVRPVDRYLLQKLFFLLPPENLASWAFLACQRVPILYEHFDYSDYRKASFALEALAYLRSPTSAADIYRIIDAYLEEMLSTATKPRALGNLSYLSKITATGHETLPPRLASAGALLGKRRAIDYAEIIGDHTYVFFGELHDSQRMAEEMISVIPFLKERGFDLAMELFNSDLQPVLDDFYAGLLLKEDLIKADRFFSMGRRNDALPLYDIAEAAVKAGVRVIGIEATHRDLDMASREVSAGMGKDILRILEDREERGEVKIAHYSAYKRSLFARNYHSAKVIADHPGKLAVYGGLNHYGRGDTIEEAMTLNGVLASMGQEVGPIVHFTDYLKSRSSGDFLDSPSQIWREVSAAAQRLRVGNERFMIPLGPQALSGLLQPDFIVHLPQPTL